MFGFKNMKILSLENKETEPKNDKKFYAIIAIFAAVIIITIIRAQADPEIAEQIRNLKFSISDGVLFALAAGGYFILKSRRRK